MRIISTYLVALIAALASVPAHGETQSPTPPTSSYGTPGLIDMPTGQVYPDGTLITSINRHSGSQRYGVTFQITPRLFGTFRYAIIDNFDGIGPARYDRSFDLGYLLKEETLSWPSLVVGLRDFGGTGIYGSEYIAGTKHFLDNRLAVTGGIGWGRLGSYNGFKNPLSAFSDRFSNRTEAFGQGGRTGQLDFDQWFRGDAAFFGGLAYQISPNLTFKAEYSSDGYPTEIANAGFDRRTPFNFGLDYHFRAGHLSAYLLHGSELGFTLNLITDPRKGRAPAGLEKAPPALLPRKSHVDLGWGREDAQPARRAVAEALKNQGMVLEGMRVQGNVATLRLNNTRYPATAQALGRAARVMANMLPGHVDTFQIELTSHGMPLSRTTLRRGDLEELEFDLDGSWKSFARASFEDAADSSTPTEEGLYPRFEWALSPYLQPEVFDPDNPVRADIGLQAFASLEAAPGLFFSGTLRKPLVGNLDTSSRSSNSALPHVRSDVVEYTKQSDLQIKHLTAEYFFRPGRDLYGRITAGIFETMYGGVSTEVLWKPVNSALALGAEISYAHQRDFDQLLGFQDYNIMTGHASAYYDFGGGYMGQLDAGRYLAGDWGATFRLTREFNNGFRVGAFFTLTDVPFDQFGEGSFDKGIEFSIPVDWLAGLPSKDGFSTVIRPVLRDGGARLDIRNRLYDLTRFSHTPELEDRWGRFWR